MKGAKEFYDLFKNNEQFGRLHIVTGSHARGKTFQIYLLPSSEKIYGAPWLVVNNVEVYGVISGQPGWTEEYGWIHKGKWVDDFNEIVSARKQKMINDSIKWKNQREQQEKDKNELVKSLLDSYE